MSVGELNQNKNHEVVIRARASLDQSAHYMIAGKGNLKQHLLDVSQERGGRADLFTGIPHRCS